MASSWILLASQSAIPITFWNSFIPLSRVYVGGDPNVSWNHRHYSVGSAVPTEMICIIFELIEQNQAHTDLVSFFVLSAVGIVRFNVALFLLLLLGWGVCSLATTNNDYPRRLGKKYWRLRAAQYIQTLGRKRRDIYFLSKFADVSGQLRPGLKSRH